MLMEMIKLVLKLDHKTVHKSILKLDHEIE